MSVKSPGVRKVTLKDDDRGSPQSAVHELSCCQCANKVTSVNLVASMAVLLLAAVAYVVAMATRNWSASGHQMKMGIWDFCLNNARNLTWTCFPVNTDFSVATQAFYILAAMCYASIFVLYVLMFVFPRLQKSRPLAIGMCLIAFAIVSLQMMTLVVYGTKNRDLYLKIQKDYFNYTLEQLFLSWSFYFAIVSTLLSTVTGALLFVEFRNLAYESIYQEPPEQ